MDDDDKKKPEKKPGDWNLIIKSKDGKKKSK